MLDALGKHFHGCPIYRDEQELVYWIAEYTGSCVYGNKSATSWLLGYFSVVVWLGAQLPQVITNHMNGSVEGLSPEFLAFWLLGDFLNFSSCILLPDLPFFQTLLASYYVCIDLVLSGQYFYYTRPHRMHNRQVMLKRQKSMQSHKDKKKKDKKGKKKKALDARTSVAMLIPVTRPRSGSLKSLVAGSLLASSLSKVQALPIPQKVQASKIDIDTVGICLAWLCAICYVSCRAPQIYKNYIRKSTSGTSIFLFLAAFTGNLTYTLSILLSPQVSLTEAGKNFLVKELPFLLGASGTVIFDSMIFLQWFMYSENTKKQDKEHQLPKTPGSFMYKTPIWSPVTPGRLPKHMALNDNDISDTESDMNSTKHTPAKPCMNQQETSYFSIPTERTSLISSSLHADRTNMHNQFPNSAAEGVVPSSVHSTVHSILTEYASLK